MEGPPALGVASLAAWRAAGPRGRYSPTAAAATRAPTCRHRAPRPSAASRPPPRAPPPRRERVRERDRGEAAVPAAHGAGPAPPVVLDEERRRGAVAAQRDAD